MTDQAPLLLDDFGVDLESCVVLGQVERKDHRGADVHQDPEEDVRTLSALLVLDQQDARSGEDEEEHRVEESEHAGQNNLVNDLRGARARM